MRLHANVFGISIGVVAKKGLARRATDFS